MGSDSIDSPSSRIIHRFAIAAARLWRSLAGDQVFDSRPETFIAEHPGVVGRLAYGFPRLVADALVGQIAIAATSYSATHPRPAVQRMFTDQYVQLTQRVPPIT